MALLCSAKRSDSVSLLRFTYLNHVQVFSCEISLDSHFEMSIRLFVFQFLFSGYFYSLNACVVCSVSGCYSQSSWAFFDGNFVSLTRCINAIFNVGVSFSSFFSWHILSVYVISGLYHDELSWCLVHLLKFLPRYTLRVSWLSFTWLRVTTGASILQILLNILAHLKMVIVCVIFIIHLVFNCSCLFSNLLGTVFSLSPRIRITFGFMFLSFFSFLTKCKNLSIFSLCGLQELQNLLHGKFVFPNYMNDAYVHDFLGFQRVEPRGIFLICESVFFLIISSAPVIRGVLIVLKYHNITIFIFLLSFRISSD